MPGQIKWKTPDGRRPSVYFLLTVKWRDGPVWMPFLFAAFFVFTLWSSPLLPQIFGPNPDYSKVTFADGHFGKRYSNKSFYQFMDISGRIVYLSCWPRMRINSCINGMFGPQEAVRIAYAPMPRSIFRSESGVILGLWRNGYKLLDPAATEKHLTRHIDRFSPLLILFDILEGFAILILVILFMSIICGMVEGIKRMAHSWTQSRSPTDPTLTP
ncbi:hypothetical protein [Sphingomonas glacialis]|uniref:hypothetical protein n=1 Tax=Sphingomonas glacialis TaxID=658225 RepID=UPI00112D8E34|nr:hypothetical protein [Sphingomonas glacialis]